MSKHIQITNEVAKAFDLGSPPEFEEHLVAHLFQADVERLEVMFAIVKELAESDVWDSGEWSEWCHFCKSQRQFGSKQELHASDCLWLRAKALMSD